MAYPTELEHAVQSMRDAIDSIGRAIAHASDGHEAWRVLEAVIALEKDTAKLYLLANARLDAMLKREEN